MSAIKQAAVWLATTPDCAKPRPIIPHLRETYGLTAQQAIEAITESRLIRLRAT